MQPQAGQLQRAKSHPSLCILDNAAMDSVQPKVTRAACGTSPKHSGLSTPSLLWECRAFALEPEISLE